MARDPAHLDPPADHRGALLHVVPGTDPSHPADAAERIAAHLPRARLVPVDGAALVAEITGLWPDHSA